MHVKLISSCLLRCGKKIIFFLFMAYVWKLLSCFSPLFSKLTILLPSDFPRNSHFLDLWSFFVSLLRSVLVLTCIAQYWMLQVSAVQQESHWSLRTSSWCWRLITHESNPSGFSRATKLNASQCEEGVQSCHSDLPNVTAEIIFLIRHFSRILFPFLKLCLHFLLYQI